MAVLCLFLAVLAIYSAVSAAAIRPQICIGDVTSQSCDFQHKTFASARQAHQFNNSDIHFAPGVHLLNDTLHITSIDEGASITGAGRNETFVSGGLELNRWQTQMYTMSNNRATSLFVHALPSSYVPFRQLFVQSNANGSATQRWGRRYTARSPVMSYDHADASDPEHSIITFPGQLRAQYHDQQHVLATLFHCWTATTHQISRIDNLNLTLLKAPHVDIPRCEHASGKRYYIEDALEELDQPGEFYLDRVANHVLYYPYPGENVVDFVAYAPQLNTLLNISHTMDVEVSNLSFVHGLVDMDGFFIGDPDAQSASNLHSAAVAVNHAARVHLHGLTLAHVGGNGIYLNKSVSNSTLERFEVTDVGASGLRLGAFNRSAETNPTRTIVVQDGYIHDGGHTYLMGPGINMVACRMCTVTHNEVTNFSYTGVSTGYGFSEHAYNLAGSVISFNHLHHLGKGELSDMGCFYSWGGDQGNILLDNNVCHNVVNYSGGYGGWGFYTDQTTANIAFTNNLVYNTTDACLHEHYGHNVTLVNNIFVRQHAYTTEGILLSAAPTKTPGYYVQFNLTRNILAGDKIFSSTTLSEFNSSTYDYNTYWQGGVPIVFPGDVSFSQWQTGTASQPIPKDVHSVIADPLFVNASGRDFNLQPDSPALKRGFQPIDFATVGPRV
eukprot:m.43187 g.43187  ORF g.43187 m.43187 type:complete len:668 (+) comp12910_c0_seq1:2-2005(+)